MTASYFWYNIPYNRRYSMSNAIKITNISKTYGRVQALNNINLTVESGDFFALVGKNGAGKSTLIRILLGLISPDKISSTNITAPNGAI